MDVLEPLLQQGGLHNSQIDTSISTTDEKLSNSQLMGIYLSEFCPLGTAHYQVLSSLEKPRLSQPTWAV